MTSVKLAEPTGAPGELPSFQPHLLGLFHSKSQCGYSDLMLNGVSEIYMVYVLQTLDSL